MFPLHAKNFPPNATALADALEESLKQVVTSPARMVTVEEDGRYPALEAIRVSLDQARTTWRRPKRMRPVPSTDPAVHVSSFEISGRPLLVERAPIDFVCTGRNVQLGCGRDEKGEVVLILENAAQGNVEVAIVLSDLEALLLAGAQAEARQHGVSIDEVKLDLRSRSSRSLAAEVRVRARKMFLSTTVQFSGEVQIDNRLNARLSELSCSAEGALGSIACNFLGPHLERFNHREFSLLALPLGEVQLRDINLATGDKLTVTASFGGSTSTTA